ncbi:MAG: hypothetical protein FGM24_02435 [Candidatus Kapabacteria bacterium]|nr:hypothetical protein [Candidatus Kapabacteria bacterium]
MKTAAGLGMLAIMLAGCSSGTVTDPSQIVFPERDVSFTQHVRPFLTLSCAFSGCHGDVNAGGGIRLTTYYALFTDRANLVVPGAPDESLLIQTMDERIPHRFDVMRRITADQLRGIRTWISEGALNN